MHTANKRIVYPHQIYLYSLYCITVCLVPWLSKSTKTTANFAVLKGWDHLGIIAVDFEFRANHVVQ